MDENKIYIGDSVYAEVVDGFNLILSTQEGVIVSNKIVLEPRVLQALLDYIKRQKI